MAVSGIDPRLSTLRPIANYFGVTIDELMGDKPLTSKDAHAINANNIILRVPVIHWEQLGQVQTLVPSLDAYKWGNWTTIDYLVSELAFALRIKQTTLPEPFSYKSLVVVDPSQLPVDGDFVVVVMTDGVSDQTCYQLMQYLLAGTQECVRALHSNAISSVSERVRTIGTVVFWKKCYHGDVVI